MATGVMPIRRVVTGHDERGHSKVVWDGPAPNAQPSSMGSSGHTDFWVWYDTPALLTGDRDDGDLPYDFPGPATGGHLRVAQSAGRPANYTLPRIRGWYRRMNRRTGLQEGFGTGVATTPTPVPCTRPRQ